ncbi:MAG TPA: alpha-amylase family glycosyl hydrolase [Anaerolineales bacterium]|nr:alpha-amylase family glycosyl hydrolase [Anaerolineales bacterium]
MADLKWWQTGVFYQIYPRSFADGNGDGIGDFIGMSERLDYLADLGIDALWLSPHFPSPQFDVGYDISDYTDVAPEYGTLDDFKRFLDGAHRRGMRVILDLVLNHTSHLHQWFIESRSSRENPKRDWYVWRDPAPDGGPPNNWVSPFGGPAWEYDPANNQYYYHFFLKEQPDLNWRNPEVREAMWQAIRFWLDMGVDGYRLDAIGTIFEHPELPDQRSNMTEEEMRRIFKRGFPDRSDKKLVQLWQLIFEYQVEQEGVHQLMQELRCVIDEYPDRVLVGENDNVLYHGDGSNELHMVFNFPLMRTNRLTPAWIRANQRERLASLPPGAWPCNTLNNHDSTRVYSRYRDGQNDDAIARAALALMLTLRGTPFLYNGEEIGMTDYRLTDINLFRDPPAVWFYNGIVTDGMPPDEALVLAADMSRDRCRTPMQWSNAANAGFSPEGVSTWLPVNPNYAQGINVAEQQNDPDSMLNFYRKLLRVRKQTPALIAGDYTPLDETSEDYFAFLRRSRDTGQTCLVILNLSDKAHDLKFGLAARDVKCLFSTYKLAGESLSSEALKITPREIFIGELTS